MSFNKEAVDHVYSTLMTNPETRSEVYKLISDYKEEIEKFLTTDANTKTSNCRKSIATPKKVHKAININKMDSPMHYLRRQIAAQQNDQENTLTYEKRPINKVLQNVVAFVDVQHESCDRSAAVKRMLQDMGAKISETLHLGVTHAVLKEISFETFWKLKQLKVDQVSVLWVNLCWKKSAKVDESKYPAMGFNICSEEILQNLKEIENTYEPNTSKAEIEDKCGTPNSSKANKYSMFTFTPPAPISLLTENIPKAGHTNNFVTVRKKRPVIENICDITKKRQTMYSFSSFLQDKSILGKSQMPSMSTEDSLSNDSRESNIISDSQDSSLNILNSKSVKKYSTPKISTIGRNANPGSRKGIARKTLFKVTDQTSHTDSDDIIPNSCSSQSNEGKLDEHTPRKRDQRSAVSSAAKRRKTMVSSSTDTTYNYTDIDSTSSQKLSELKLSDSQEQEVRVIAKDTTKSLGDKVYLSRRKAIMPQATDNDVPKPDNKCANAEHVPYTINVNQTKPGKRRLFDLSQFSESIYADYDYEPEKSKPERKNVSSFVKKNTTHTSSPVSITDGRPGGEPLTKHNNNVATDKKREEFVQPKNIARMKTQKITTQSNSRDHVDHQFNFIAINKNRRSTLDFQTIPVQPATVTKQSRKRTGTGFIVNTRLKKEQIAYVETIVSRFGGFKIESSVSENTTHLIAGASLRTINMLKAIARGCWILSYSWLEDSGRCGKWLAEEKYELVDFSPAVQQCRLERRAFRSLYSMDLFLNCGSIFVSRKCPSNYKQLEQLVVLCKGKTAYRPERASIIVGQYDKHSTCVSEKWLLDSITYYKKMPLCDYALLPSSSTV